jgi:pimeloyl-ACP methyl ester carboxylesterase
MYYEVQGRGEPLLLVPGLGGTCRTWDELAPRLARHFTVISLDNRGMGRSVARRHPKNFTCYAADYAELLDELQLDRVSVLGMSLGGVMAQMFASDFSDRINRLVLVSSPCRMTPYLAEMAGLIGHLIKWAPRRRFLRTIALLGTSPGFVDAHPDQIEQEVREKLSSGTRRRDLAVQMRALASSNLQARVYRISVPTLVVAGEFDSLIPWYYSKMTADAIGGSEFMLVKNAGHNPMVEQPHEVLPRIEQFLRGGRRSTNRHSDQLAPAGRLAGESRVVLGIGRRGKP